MNGPPHNSSRPCRHARSGYSGFPAKPHNYTNHPKPRWTLPYMAHPPAPPSHEKPSPHPPAQLPHNTHTESASRNHLHCADQYKDQPPAAAPAKPPMPDAPSPYHPDFLGIHGSGSLHPPAPYFHYAPQKPDDSAPSR